MHPLPPYDRSDEELIGEFRTVLEDAVRLRLRSDVPIGTCLSGGVDSSSIVCLVNRLLRQGSGIRTNVGDRQKTFSSVYEYPEINEGPFIDAVIEHTGVEGHRVTPRGEELLEIAPRLIWHQGEPFGSTSIYSQWHVMQLTHSSDVTVLLDGQGADELLGGYSFYYPSFLAELIRTGHLMALRREWGSFPFHLNLSPNITFLRALHRLLLYVIKRERLYLNKPAWLHPRFLSQKHDLSSRPHYKSILDNHLYKSITTSLLALLHYEDHNSMAFSIESRVPYLDHRLVELGFRLPMHLKIHNGTTKVVLREAMRGILPEMVRNRKDKLGFPAPGDIWFREHIADEAERIFRSRSFREHGYIKSEEAIALLQKHREGRVRANETLWRMICLELWVQIFFDHVYPYQTC
ncbi:MAG: hypothetical protein DRO11_07345 [Methanobacteriota archaeon]|nr:MAG: hypothetical protein DRO11_07345 [Euryarchaeota archaeon]